VVVFHCLKKLIRVIRKEKIIIVNKNIKLKLINLPYIMPIIYKNKIMGIGLIDLYLLF
jgi:hypothetical protein